MATAEIVFHVVCHFVGGPLDGETLDEGNKDFWQRVETAIAEWDGEPGSYYIEYGDTKVKGRRIDAYARWVTP